MDNGRIGILTGGGDCPGLNAVIRAVVRRAMLADIYVLGVKSGWQGLITGDVEPLTRYSVAGIQPKGGTILGTSRTDPFTVPDALAKIKTNWRKFGLRALVVAGGNGTLSVAMRMFREEGYAVVGVPKTIDNDIVGTDVTFGFHTAVQIATDAIDRLHTTAESHDRVMVVEVMGRDTGWIATYAGIAGGATIILIPEQPFDIDEVCAVIERRHDRGRYASIVVVAEGAAPAGGTLELPTYKLGKGGHRRLGGIAAVLAAEIEARTGFDTRVVQIGHVQRGGTPNAYDRVLSTRYGLAAIDAVHDRAWGEMVVLRSTVISRAPLTTAVGKTRTVDMNLYEGVAEVFFG